MRTPKKVAVIGYGSWGTAIARLVGKNVLHHPRLFSSTVKFWVAEKTIDGKKLTDIINDTHENVKYLPGRHLPHNVVAMPDLVEVCQDANILLFVVPHQAIKRTILCNIQNWEKLSEVLDKLEGRINPTTTVAVSLIKGISKNADGNLKLISEEIDERLQIDTCVLMGANLAPEVADDKFCEATLGCNTSAENIINLEKLFNCETFRVNVVPDAATVELCGALKNVVACAAGFVDGLKCGDNTKAAVMRLGFMEMTRFVECFYPGSQVSTFLESCGMADLITSCYGGRNRKVCEAFVHAKKPLKLVEEELLNGQSAQGPLTAAEVHQLLEKSQATDKFPLFTAVHRICQGHESAKNLIDCLKHHPEYQKKPLYRVY